jgi:hypothetical protein
VAPTAAKVDREQTPWLIAMWHTPWYTSNHHHPMTEGAQMRASMERILYQAEPSAVKSLSASTYPNALNNMCNRMHL